MRAIRRLAATGPLVAVGLLALSPSPARAQNGERLAGVYVGWATSTDENAPDGDVSGAMHLYFPVRPSLAAGFNLGYLRLGEIDSTFTDSGSGNSAAGTRGFSTWQTTGGLMWHLPRGHFRPYLVAEAGAYGFRVSDEAAGFSRVDNTPRFGVNAGGGIRWVAGHGPWGLGLEARWHGIFEALDGRNVNAITILAGMSYSPGGVDYED